MNIAIVEDDTYYNSIKVDDCKLFNPGVGGGTYQFINLYNVLSTSNFNVYFVHKNKSNFIDIAPGKNILFDNNQELFEILEDLNLDNIILPQRFGYDLLDKFKLLSVPITYRCGNYLNAKEVKYLSNDIVKNVVCLNWEHASKCYDTDLFHKIVIIPNFINLDILKRPLKSYNANAENSFVITYIGSITPSKGLHLLAKVWHKIVKIIPNAELNIIGSKSLYDAKLDNSHNIYSPYEMKVKAIFDKDSVSSSKVVYHGKLGIEKYSIISKTDIGVVNPSGKSEIFTNSVVDFSLYNVPVLGRNKYGLVSMIENGINGFKFNSLEGLIDKIIYIYKNNDIEFKGVEFIKRKFANESYSFKNWILLFHENKRNSLLFSNIKHSKKMVFHNLFALRVISRYLQKLIPFSPSVLGIEFFLKDNYRKTRKFFMGNS